MNEMIVAGSDFEMTSLDFLDEVINPARVAAGEQPHEPRKFLAKVEDEIGESLTGKKFRLNNNLTKTFYYDLTMDQMLLVGMRESKAVRRSVLAKLKELSQTTAPQQQTQLIPGTPEHFAACYRAYFGEPVQNALTNQQQHTEPVEALPPVGEHHACPTNKISFTGMEQYVSNPALRKRLLEEFGLEGELFDPGCVKGTNTPAKPYVVYDRAKVMAVLKATQKLGKNGQEKVLGRKFTVKTVVPVTSYAGDDFDAAYALLKLLEE